jgi:hypothetical protein
MNNVICNGISVCNISRCEHKQNHSKHVRCESVCMNQIHKGNFSCKDYTIIMRKLKLKKLNGITSR